MDLTRFATGADEITSRPLLIRDLIDVLHADSRGRKVEFRGKVSHWLQLFWSFLDLIEASDGGAIQRVSEIDSELGQLFKNWLLAERHLRADNAKGIFNAVHRILQTSRKFHRVPNWPLAWPTIASESNLLHRDIDPAIFIPLYNELKRRHRMTHAMRVEGAELLPSGKDPRVAERGNRSNSTKQAAFANPANLAWLANAWISETFERPKTTMRAFGGNYFCDVPTREIPPTAPTAIPEGNRTRFDTVRWFLPTIEDTAAAHFLVTIHTGWNPETVESIDVSSPDRWCDHRLGAEEGSADAVKTVAIYGFKDKVDKEQIAFSMLRPTFHPYQVISSMIRWTEPMRRVLQERLSLLKEKASPTDQDRSDIEWLEEHVRSPWLYFSPKAAGPCGLRIAIFRTPSIKNRVLREIATAAHDAAARNASSDEERTKLSTLLEIRQSDLRDGFAAFLYENSLYNILLVKRALGHSSLRSTRHYLRQRRHIAQRFREFREFQTIFFDEVRQFKAVDPTILFLRVRYGEITDEQRARLTDHRLRTRMEMGCLDPTNPPPEVTNEIAGPCRVHRCTICRHGVVFEESLVGLARRSAELRLIRGRSASERFQSSTFQKEWTAIEWLKENFFAKRIDEFHEAADLHYADLVSGRAYLFDQAPGGIS